MLTVTTYEYNMIESLQVKISFQLCKLLVPIIFYHHMNTIKSFLIIIDCNKSRFENPISSFPTQDIPDSLLIACLS